MFTSAWAINRAAQAGYGKNVYRSPGYNYYGGTVNSKRAAAYFSRQKFNNSRSQGTLVPASVLRRNRLFKKYAVIGNRLSPELRSIDWNFSGTYSSVYSPDSQPLQGLNINTSGCLQALTNIQQGTGLSQRLANRVSLKGLRVRLSLVQTGNSPRPTTSNMRFIVFYDRAPNGSYLTTNSLLTNLTQNNTTTSGGVFDNLNPSYFQRIVVLKDIKMVLPASTTTSQQVPGPYDQQNYEIDFYLKLKNLECMYTQTSNPAVIANSSVGSVQFAVIGDVAAGSEPYYLTGSVRLRFDGN
nr:MAG: capsid protein [Cressdnaviricota sp.]